MNTVQINTDLRQTQTMDRCDDNILNNHHRFREGENFAHKYPRFPDSRDH